jgi:hypothetical protein
MLMTRTGPEFQFDRNKFRELALYVATKTAPENLGAVKFNKVLYYSDMLHYVMKGHPITGATYRRRERGPTTDQLLFALRELTLEGAIQISNVPFYGFMKKEYRALKEPDLSKFTADEIALVDDVIQFVCDGHTAKGISEFSHNLAWEATEPDQEIPYFTAFLMYPADVSEATLDWAHKEAPSIEAERQKRNPVERPLFRALRASL